MNDMRKLLSNALPGPEDEPRQRDVIDSAMDWGEKRRRRDWALTGAAALAVAAVGAGVAAMSGGSAGGVSPAGGPKATRSSAPGAGLPDFPAGTRGTENCAVSSPSPTHSGGGNDFCQLFLEQENFGTE